MDLSALIFVALAVAWATYLIPKALRHHEDSSASRNVEGFSARIRVLARREPVDSKSARLVVGAGQPARTAKPVFSAEATVGPRPRPVPVAVRRAAAARAARRRLRVVLVILLAAVGVGVAASLGRVGYVWLAAPGGLLVAWLVACRMMVARERAAEVPVRRLPLVVDEPRPRVDDGDPVTEEIVAVEVEVSAGSAPAAPVEPEPTPEPARAADAGWDPVPTTLPTYVGKEPAARRSVRTIDLDSTGVWTSGPLAADSALAREADAERAARSSRADDEKKRRASGS